MKLLKSFLVPTLLFSTLLATGCRKDSEPNVGHGTIGYVQIDENSFSSVFKYAIDYVSFRKPDIFMYGIHFETYYVYSIVKPVSVTFRITFSSPDCETFTVVNVETIELDYDSFSYYRSGDLIVDTDREVILDFEATIEIVSASGTATTSSFYDPNPEPEPAPVKTSI